jgi:hypothetical protein
LIAISIPTKNSRLEDKRPFLISDIQNEEKDLNLKRSLTLNGKTGPKIGLLFLINSEKFFFSSLS